MATTHTGKAIQYNTTQGPAPRKGSGPFMLFSALLLSLSYSALRKNHVN